MKWLIGLSVALIAASGAALAIGWAREDESLIYASIGTSITAFVLLVAALLISRRQPAAAGGTPSAPPAWAPGDRGGQSAAGTGPQSWSTAWGGVTTPAGPSGQGPSSAGAPVPQREAAEASAEIEAAGAAGAAPVETADGSQRPAAQPEAPGPPAGVAPEAVQPETGVTPEAPGPEVGVAPEVDAGAAPKELQPEPAGAAAPTGAPPGRAGSRAVRVVAYPQRKKFHKPECRHAKAEGGEIMTKATARRRAYTACGICKP